MNNNGDRQDLKNKAIIHTWLIKGLGCTSNVFSVTASLLLRKSSLVQQQYKIVLQSKAMQRHMWCQTNASANLFITQTWLLNRFRLASKKQTTKFMQTMAYQQHVNVRLCCLLFRPAVGVLIIKLGKPSKLHEPASGRHPYSYKVGLTCI